MNYYVNTVSVIDTASNTVTATIPVGSGPGGVAVTPDGSRVYIGNEGGNVSVIDTASNTVTATIPTSGAYGLAVTPDGSAVYVAAPAVAVLVISRWENTSSPLAPVLMSPTVTAPVCRQAIDEFDGSTNQFPFDSLSIRPRLNRLM